MKTAKLSDVCRLITRGISPKYTEDEKIGITVLNQKCIRNKTLSYEFSRLHNPLIKSINETKFVKSGDILINSTGSGTLGRTALVEDTSRPLLVDSHITILRPIEGLFEPRYFAYLIGQSEKDFIEMATGTSGQTELPRAHLNEYEISYEPVLEEQRRIVARLDEAFEKIDRAIRLTERNLQNSRVLHSSKLSGVFTDNSWPTCELADHVKFIDYRGRTPKKTTSGMRLITAKNIKLGYLQDEPREYVSPSIYNEWMTRGIPNRDDVLFTTEAPLANVAQLSTDERVVFAQRCIVLQPDRSFFDPGFLKYMIMADPVRSDILFNGTGTTVKGIKASVLKKIRIFKPKVQEQKEIAQKLDELTEQTQKLQAFYQKKINHLKALRQSLLQQAFSTTDKV